MVAFQRRHGHVKGKLFISEDFQLAFVHIDKENRTNLEAKSKKCTFIGYGVNDFGYRLMGL
jgi:hypothetical protein